MLSMMVILIIIALPHLFFIFKRNHDICHLPFPFCTTIASKTRNIHHGNLAVALMQWFRDFRMNRESFVNVPKRRSFIKRLPPIFDDNPDMKNKFMNFAKENLVNLNPELMYDYCNDKYRYRKIKASGREFLAAILRCRFQDSGDVHPICGETHTGVQVSPQMPSKRIGLRA